MTFNTKWYLCHSQIWIYKPGSQAKLKKKTLIVPPSWQILRQKLKGGNRLSQNTGALFIETTPVTLGFQLSALLSLLSPSAAFFRLQGGVTSYIHILYDTLPPCCKASLFRIKVGPADSINNAVKTFGWWPAWTTKRSTTTVDSGRTERL